MWYKLTFEYGPGHQGHGEEYKWYDRKLSKADRESLWHSEANQYSHSESVAGKVIKIKRLPEEIRKAKILSYKIDIDYAKRMLKRLGGE